MKKFSIFAAALLFAGAANAQVASSNIGSAPAANALTLPTGQVGIDSYTRNISDIEQVGANQHSVVTQTGNQAITGLQNVASLKQIAPSASAGFNNATQTQTNTLAAGGAATANRMEGEQRGTRSTMSQTQTGYGNKASGFQLAGSSENLMTQVQTGVDNQVFSEQRGTLSKSVQTQTGARNQGVVIQTSPAGYNLATQSQSGDDNRAYAGQGTQGGGIGIWGTGYNHSDQTQVGNSNYSRTDQFGSDDRSTVSQTGNNNTATVNQH